MALPLFKLRFGKREDMLYENYDAGRSGDFLPGK